MTKTITVSDDVYELLVKAKLPNESFSGVIRRSIKKGMKISDIAGSKTISEKEWKKVLKAFKPQRKTDDEEKIFS
jgi:predicted CopG family antitoxin